MTRIPLKAIDGHCLSVKKTGNGPVIVALHGFTGDCTTWLDFIDAAKKKYTTITIDILGHGDSDAPNDSLLYSMERTVESLAELLDHFNIQRTHWLGYSMGGRIALSAAIALPHRSLTLIMESGSPGLKTSEERIARTVADESLADWIEKVGIERFIDYWQSIPLWASQARLDESVRHRLRMQRIKNKSVGLANSLRGIGTGAQPPLHHKVPELQIPALFIAGEEDIRYVEIAHEFGHKAVHSSVQIIEEAGHAAHLEQTEKFNHIALDFLDTAEHQSANDLLCP